MTSVSWQKVENENGFPGYINEHTNVKQWDHPKFADIKQTIDECNYIKFSSYRVAAKIRVLQRSLYMDEIPISLINGIFEKHRLGSNEASLHLESYDLEAILSDIYFAANKHNHTNTDIDFATELMQNFLYNVYDKDRKGTLQVISTRITLGLLSSAKLSELYKYFYILSADYNNSVTKFRLQNILTHLANITKFLHEDAHFGPQLIQTTLESCFKDVIKVEIKRRIFEFLKATPLRQIKRDVKYCQQVRTAYISMALQAFDYIYPGTMGITEFDFLTWLESGPQIIAYIPTLYRMRTAETVIHNVRCSVCKATPVIGLKYRCLRCSRYTQCQKCFLSARTSHSHKPGHPMREYCTEKCSKELSHMFIKRLCGILRCSLRLSPHNVDFIEPGPPKTDREYLIKSSEIEESNITPLSCPQVQLQIVIRQLELQNRELQNQVSQLHGRTEKEMKKYLEEHRLHIAQQIQKLKLLKNYLQNHQKTEGNRLESTPMVRNSNMNFRNKTLDNFSPIMRPPDFSVIPEVSDVSQSMENSEHIFKNNTTSRSLPAYSVRDISSWIADRPATSSSATSATCSSYVDTNTAPTGPHAKEMQNDLDAVLDKLQQILANNFSLDDSVSTADNDQLQEAVSEMEGMLTSLIDGVETSRANSVLQTFPPDSQTLLF